MEKLAQPLRSAGGKSWSGVAPGQSAVCIRGRPRLRRVLFIHSRRITRGDSPLYGFCVAASVARAGSERHYARATWMFALASGWAFLAILALALASGSSWLGSWVS